MVLLRYLHQGDLVELITLGVHVPKGYSSSVCVRACKRVHVCVSASASVCPSIHWCVCLSVYLMRILSVSGNFLICFITHKRTLLIHRTCSY